METRLLSCVLLLLWRLDRPEGRVVWVPRGPLVRVEGQPVSLPCTVSEYEGPDVQDFDWLLLEAKEVPVISSMDMRFTDPRFAHRVSTGDISVVRLQDSEVELRFRAVNGTDAGVYRCRTPSTDNVISGNYEADVQLIVIRGSLQVVPVVPMPLVQEGIPLELRCNATWDAADRTYLSTTWYVQKGAGPAEDVLTVGPDGSVLPGRGFVERYARLGLRVEPRGGGDTSLVLSETLPGDTGVYGCTAREQTPEEGGAWSSILEKSVELGHVSVTPIAESVTVSVGNVSVLTMGESLHLSCAVSLGQRDSVGWDVTWLVSGVGQNVSRVLVRLGRDGVVHNSSDSVWVERVGASVVRLTVRQVDRSDSGRYTCRVEAWLRQSNRWYLAAVRSSQPTVVKVTLIEADFTVSLRALLSPLSPGDPMELHCEVTSLRNLPEGRLSVTWYYDGNGSASSRPIAALDEHGDLMLWDEYRPVVEKGLVTLWRIKPLSYRIRFLQMRESDRGVYHCSVTAWTRNRAANWTRNREISSDKFTIQWAQRDPVLAVSARRVKDTPSAGSTFEMSCQVKAENVDASLSVSVQLEETVGGGARRLLSLGTDGVLQLEQWSEAERLDAVVLQKTGAREFLFRLYGAQVSDRGFYSCLVAAWTRDPAAGWKETLRAESNRVQLSFDHKGPSFNISLHSDQSSLYPREMAQMQCSLSVVGTALSAGDVSYEVQWYQNQEAFSDGAVLVASVDRWGVVTKSPRNSSSDCSLERSDPHTFRLSLHNTQSSDAGEYQCVVTPWLRSSSGTWTKGPDLTSTQIFLMVHFQTWESLKLPLLYGAGAAVLVGLLSILLGFLCTHCCCQKSPRVSRRSHNSLISLE